MIKVKYVTFKVEKTEDVQPTYLSKTLIPAASVFSSAARQPATNLHARQVQEQAH